jgi:HK97 family phage portal protein
MNLLSRLASRVPVEERQGLVQILPTWANQTERKMGNARNAYTISSTVHSAINARQRVFSEVRFALRSLDNGDLTKNHGSLRLLERPWPGGTGTELLKRMELDASLSGIAVVYKPSSSRLQCLDPMKCEIQTDGFEFAGVLYWPNGIGTGNPVPIRREEVAIWSPLPHPEHQYLGASWVEVVATELRTEVKMQRHQEKFFDNSATPNMYVKVKGTMKEESRVRLRQELERRYSGVANAWKTLVMDNDASIEKVGNSFAEMDYVNVIKSTEGRIASAAGTPPIIIGAKAGLDASTYSNYNMAMRAFADHLIRPNWNSVVAALEPITNIPRGTELWFDDSDVAALRADKKEEASIQQTVASTIRTYLDAGFDPDIAVQAATNHDPSLLIGAHSGLFSVQLQPPGTTNPDDAVAVPARAAAALIARGWVVVEDTPALTA